MRIETVKFKNYCQHKDLEVELGAGVVGIVGKNGCGKSNLLKGILRGLTGASGNPGKKEEDVSWGTDKGSIEVEFWSGNTLGKIHRDLATTRCKLEFGGSSYKTATDIDKVVYDILGISPKLLAETVFVSQGTIESVLFQKPADRAKSLQALFGTEGAEKLRELLQEELNLCHFQDRSGELKALEQELAGVQQQLKALQTERECKHAQLLTPEELQQQRELCQQAQTYQVRAEALARLQRAQAQLQAQLTQLQAEEQEAKELVTELAGLVTELNTPAQAAQARVNSQAQAALQIKLHKAQLEQKKAAQTLLTKPAPAGCAITAEQVETLRKRLSDLQGQERLSAKLISLVGAASICPTCDQPLAPTHIAKHKAQLTALRPEIVSLQTRLIRDEGVFKAYERTLAIHESEQRMAKQQLAAAEQALAQFPAAPRLASAESLQADQELIAQFQQLLQDLQAQQAQVKAVAGQIARMQQQLQRGSQELKQAHAELGEPVTAAALALAQGCLTTHTQLELQLASLDGQHQTLEAQQQTLATKQQQYALEQQQQSKFGQWRELLERSRAILHRDQLPNLVAQTFLRELNVRLAKYLELFGVPFTAVIKPDLSIDCYLTGARQVVAERLSGGEKVMLGIAFRFAVYDLFASNLGLLILDEPTVYLDEDRIDAVFGLLERVKGYSRSAGLQLIVVTHEQRLCGVFDKLIQL